MKSRAGYAGAVGMLLTLACGPRVEIGHGDAAGGDNGAGGTVSSAGSGSGAQPGSAGVTSTGGAPVQTGGTASTAGAPTGVGGPIPADNGPQMEVDKVDLLLAVDNSLSMAEKQQLFAQTIPELLKRLVNPHCVTPAGMIAAEPASGDAPCPAGSNREFEPLRDLHVGVITSSLGSHGANGAKDVCVTVGDNDHAHLIPLVRQGVASYNDQGYLKWDPDGLATPPGESDVTAFASSLATMIESAGENGCGYEAQLESVYRFLVDPEPPISIELPMGRSVTGPVGIDDALLTQRANFLRPDSSVVVLMLTDENDCSIQDEGYGWLIARAAPMYRSTSVCQSAPNDPCCQSCGEAAANPGCSPIQQDSECVQGNSLPAANDDLNLRCWKQKQRFGFDLLYSTDRYVSGFGDGQVLNRAGELVDNPLFHRDGVDRDRSLFTLAVVGGVPWQDIATTRSLTSDGLEFMTAEELNSTKRWAAILGDPKNDIEPSDPFMREFTAVRGGKNPFTGEIMDDASSTDPRGNTINGHEHVDSGRDLQYACTFQLPEPFVCDQARFDSDQGCDCFAEDLAVNSSTCNPPGGGPAGTTQYMGKAYPALRELAVAQELGRRSVLGSICARNTQDDTRSDYGYRPVFGAIGRRVAATLAKP
jgi:hypothetical protein